VDDQIVNILINDLPQNLAKKIISKIDTEANYVFSEKEFLLILKDHIEEEVKTKFFFDSQDAVDHTVLNVFSRIGADQSYVLFQFVLAYISLNI
jgi:hypothetical protein